MIMLQSTHSAEDAKADQQRLILTADLLIALASYDLDTFYQAVGVEKYPGNYFMISSANSIALYSASRISESRSA